MLLVYAALAGVPGTKHMHAPKAGTLLSPHNKRGRLAGSLRLLQIVFIAALSMNPFPVRGETGRAEREPRKIQRRQ